MANTADVEKKGNKVKRTTNTLLALTALSIATCVVSDRIIPSTDNVRVEGNIVSLIPQVSGEIFDFQVESNKFVQKGDVLAQINPTDYEIAVHQAESKLKLAGQEVGAKMASIVSAQAQLTNALVSQENVKRQAQRMLEMEQKGVVSSSDGDKTRAELDKADAAVLKAQANLEKAKSELGEEGSENAGIQSALLELKQAQLDLERTKIRAPSNGAVTNFSLSEGTYASRGNPLMTFVEKDGLWIEAYFRENSMGNIEAGDTVDVALDFAPGEVFKGRVKSVDLGVEWNTSKTRGVLASVKNQNGWLRDSQRMPVTIQLDDSKALEAMRIGGQADVVVYTQDNGLLNTLGKLWIHLVSWFSYVR